MRIFVTGGTGFIGSHLIDAVKDQHDILVLSRNEHHDFAKVRFIKGSLANTDEWKDALTEFTPEVAIHLAWEGLPDYSPTMCITNLQHSLNLFNLLKGMGCPKVIGVGSGWEYGPTVGRAHEDSKVMINNSFCAAKNAVRVFGEDTFSKTSSVFVWARIFFSYGPGQRPTSLIPRLITYKRGGEVPQFPNPDSKNDFIYIGDVASAIVALAKSDNAKGTYNIGSGKLKSVRDVANILAPELVANLPKQKTSGLYASIEKIDKDTGWKPSFSLRQGIAKSLQLSDDKK